MTTKKRLALFLPSLEGGGAERVMLTLAGGFVEAGVLVDLVLACARGTYLDQVPDRVRIVNLQSSRVLRSLPPLMDYLRCERPATFLSALDHANIIALLARRIAGLMIRCVVSVHGLPSFEQRHAATWRARFMPLVVARLYPWADKIVAVSQGVARDLARSTKLDPEAFQVIHNPVFTPHLLLQSRIPPQHPWFGQAQPPVVLGVGRLTAAKDFSTLIRAFARVRGQCRARLMILGEGEERPRLERLVSDLGLQGEVALPGFVKNPYAYMSRAVVFVLSSAWEAFGNVLVEAMAVGTPVIATDCPGGPAEILEGGRYGPLVGVGDDAGLAKAMFKFLEGYRPQTSKLVGRATDFGLESAVSAYREVLNL